jgi:hypothetical protein
VLRAGAGGADRSHRHAAARLRAEELFSQRRVHSHTSSHATQREENTMGFGKGALLWLLGIPLPIILLLALFWR